MYGKTTKQHLFRMQHTFLYFFAIAERQRLLSLGQTGWKIGALRYNQLYSPSLYIPTLSWDSGHPVYYGHRTTSQNF